MTHIHDIVGSTPYYYYYNNNEVKMVYKYKKIEPVVSAIQYTGDNKNEVIDFCNTRGSRAFEDPNMNDILYVVTKFNDHITDSVVQVKVGCFLISETLGNDLFDIQSWEEDDFNTFFNRIED